MRGKLWAQMSTVGVPYCEALARLADEPGAASRLKVVLNTWIAGLVETLGESIALAEALGLDPADFLAAIEDGTSRPPTSLHLAAKDAGLAVEAAQGAGIELPLAEAVRMQMTRGANAGHQDKDMAATFLTARGEA